MADFGFADDLELKQLNDNVLEHPEEFEHWEKLVRAAEQQEGGLTRNSSPGAIQAMRDVYDRFLARFPLFFGYWKKYADLEFTIAGTEAAELVYERGVASIGASVDLWVSYCTFKTETSHNETVNRELFERATEAVGLDFLAHPLWDKYVEYEERLDGRDQIFAILARVIHIPLHQYSRYYQRFHDMAEKRATKDLAPEEVLARLMAELAHEPNVQSQQGPEFERELRARLSRQHQEIFAVTQVETTNRWTFEQAIKRPYYHVTELDEQQLANWRSYLDFEEAAGDYARIKFLYERCLVTAANYDEFWFRYARWMSAQPGKDEEVRNIYARASCIFVPISQPDIRLNYAHFEESVGRTDIATDIYGAILGKLPNDVDTIISLANLYTRQHGASAAIDLLKQYFQSFEHASDVRGALVRAWGKLVWEDTGDENAARKVWAQHEEHCQGSLAFWSSWFEFEENLPTSSATRERRHEAIKHVYDKIRDNTKLDFKDVAHITATYIAYLKSRGGPQAMAEVMQLDKETYGPRSVRRVAQQSPSEVALNAQIPQPGSVTGRANGYTSANGQQHAYGR